MAAAVVAAAVLEGCGSASRSEGTLAEHATTAGYVMTPDHFPRWAVESADRVAGSADGVTIEVLSAEGSTLAGQVVLRVSVDLVGAGSFGTDDKSAACYEYRFEQTHLAAAPRRLSACPPGRPLDMSRVPAEAGVSAATRSRVQDLLGALPADVRTSPAGVEKALTSALGPGYFVEVSSNPTGVTAQVYSGGECLSARTGSTTVAVDAPRSGLDCLGG